MKDGRCDAGLLIHEGQLFYESMGLHKVLDLGEWWHKRTGLPLPMGGNAIRRDLVDLRPSKWLEGFSRVEKLQRAVSLEDYGEVMVSLAAAAWGMDYPNLSEQDLEVVKQKLVELKPNVKTFWSSASEVVQLMANGEVDMAYGWPDTYAQVLDP